MGEQATTIPLGNALIIWTTILLLSSSSFVAVRLWAKWQQYRPWADGVFIAGYVCASRSASEWLQLTHETIDRRVGTVYNCLLLSNTLSSRQCIRKSHSDQLRELDGGRTTNTAMALEIP